MVVDRRADLTLAAALAAGFLQMMGVGVLLTILPFLALELGAASWQVALLFSAFALGAFISEPVWGRLSDRVGRRIVLAVTLGFSAIAIAALIVAPTIWIALAARLAAGLGSGNIATFQALVLDVSAPAVRVRRVGYLGGAFSLGFVAGPVIGGLLGDGAEDASGFTAALLLSAACSAAASACILAFARSGSVVAARAAEARTDALALIRQPAIARVIAVTLIAILGFAGLDAVFGLWAKSRFDWGPVEVGRCFMLFGVTSAIAQGLLADQLGRRIGVVAVARTGLGLAGAGLVALALAPSPPLAVAALVVIILGEGLVQPSLPVLIQRNLRDPGDQGAALGLNMGAGSLARILSPAGAGAIYTAFGPAAALLTCAGLCAAALAASSHLSSARPSTRIADEASA